MSTVPRTMRCQLAGTCWLTRKSLRPARSSTAAEGAEQSAPAALQAGAAQDDGCDDLQLEPVGESSSAVHTRVTKVIAAMPTATPTSVKTNSRRRSAEMPQKRAAEGEEPKAMMRRPVTVRRSSTHDAA